MHVATQSRLLVHINETETKQLLPRIRLLPRSSNHHFPLGDGDREQMRRQESHPAALRGTFSDLSPETCPSKWLWGDLRALGPPAEPQVQASHFLRILPFISSAVMFASEAFEEIRHPASNKLCYLVYNLRLKLKKKKTNELPLALVFLVAGSSHFWKPSKESSLGTGFYRSCSGSWINYSKRTRGADRKKACWWPNLFSTEWLFLFWCMCGSFVIDDKVVSLQAPPAAPPKPAPGGFSEKRGTPSIRYPGKSKLGVFFQNPNPKSWHQGSETDCLWGHHKEVDFVLTGACKSGPLVPHPLSAWCFEYGFDGC